MAHLRVVSSYPDQADPPDHEVDSQDDEEVDLDQPVTAGDLVKCADEFDGYLRQINGRLDQHERRARWQDIAIAILLAVVFLLIVLR